MDYGHAGRIALLEARVAALESLVAELTKPKLEAAMTSLKEPG